MDFSTPGFPVHHQLPELAQIHVLRVSDATQWPHPMHPLLPLPASGSFPKSQIASGGQSIGTSAPASVLPMNIQGLSPLEVTGWISLQSKGLSRVFSNQQILPSRRFWIPIWSSPCWVFIGRTDVASEIPVLWPPDAKSWLICKDPDAGKDWEQEEKGTTEDKMVGWHHQLNGHGFEWAPGVGDGQGGLACCSPWGRKELDTRVDELNWTSQEYLRRETF